MDSVTFWIDATCMLHRVKNPNLRPVLFEANRLGRIHALSKLANWRYTTTDKNPADVRSRGLAPCKCRDIDAWLLDGKLLEADVEWPYKIFRSLLPSDLERQPVNAMAV